MIEKRLYPLIVGNIPGVDDNPLSLPTDGTPKRSVSRHSDDLLNTKVVVICSQNRKRDQKVKPLKVMSSESSGIARSDLVDLQQKDKSLAKPFIFVKTEKRLSSGRGQYWFEFDNGLLVQVWRENNCCFAQSHYVCRF